MKVLEAIQKRRTARMPFNSTKVSASHVDTLLEIARLSPIGDRISWHLITIDDDMIKSQVAQIVRQTYQTFQTDSQKFKEVYSQYPRWLHFSDLGAKDGVVLNMPKPAKYFYDVSLGKTLGPVFGRLGIMNAEQRDYCRNIQSAPLVFGVFLDKHSTPNASGVEPMVNAGAMLQNLRLTATSLGLSYQDLGLVTATERGAETARKLSNMAENYIAVNFFRVGYPDALSKPPEKRTDVRRDLNQVVHFGRYGETSHDLANVSAEMDVLEAIRGQRATRQPGVVTREEFGYVLEAARWAPTGFNVQPFEFVVIEAETVATIAVLEDEERRDPDPGFCAVLARGGVLQNIVLAARALGLDSKVAKPAAQEEEGMRKELGVPRKYAIPGLVRLTWQ